MIAIEKTDQTAVLKLNRGAANPINGALVDALRRAIAAAGADSDVRAVVLTSASDKFFSIGWDIPELIGMGRAELAEFFRAFCGLALDLYTLPKPTVAAVNRHATAGGCILALCCDERFIAAGRNLIGLNEVKLGLPVPHAAECILRDLAGSRAAREIIESGAFFEPEQSLRLGVVDRIIAASELRAAAIERAAALGGSPAAAFAAAKRGRVERVEAQIAERANEKERLFLDLWFSEPARRAIEAAKEKF